LREKRGLEEERREKKAKGIPRGCQGLFTPVSLGYPLSVFNKNSTLKQEREAGPSFSQKKEEGEAGSSFSSLLLDEVGGGQKREKRGHG